MKVPCFLNIDVANMAKVTHGQGVLLQPLLRGLIVLLGSGLAKVTRDFWERFPNIPGH